MLVIYLCYSVAKIKQKSEISLYYFANCLYFLCKTQKRWKIEMPISTFHPKSKYITLLLERDSLFLLQLLHFIP